MPDIDNVPAEYYSALGSLYRACRDDHDKLYRALAEAVSRKHLPALLRRHGFTDQDIELLMAIEVGIEPDPSDKTHSPQEGA